MTASPILVAVAVMAAGMAMVAAGEPTSAEHIAFFESRIRPVLVDKCYACHSEKAAKAGKLKGGLRLDSRAGMGAGGESGPALVPGKPEVSRILAAMRGDDPDLQMPPKDKLPATVVADFADWVRHGAPDPRIDGVLPQAGGVDVATARAHWTFLAPLAVVPPTPRDATWAKGPIDRFVLAALEARNLRPAPLADARTRLRRAAMTLTGLPPTDAEVAVFAADPSPAFFAAAIDRLLASPHFGERWGRHWLDVARYADTKGYVFEEERRYPYAYAYRDWVIRSINADLPYDRFIALQIAADRLIGDGRGASGDRGDLAALGFLTVGRRFLNNQPDIIDDRLDVVGRGLLGLTISCARCHDHKFDPIPTADYYALYGVFANSNEPKDQPLLGARSAETAAYEEERDKHQATAASFVAQRRREILSELGTAKNIARYLIEANEAASLADKDLGDRAEKRKLRTHPLRRWREALAKADAKHALLGPWKAFAALPTERFASESGAVAARLAGDAATNPLIAKALTGVAPATLAAAADLLAGVAAASDGDSVHADPAREVLRLALRGPDAPLALPAGDGEKLFDGDDRKKHRELQKKVDELAANHPGAPARAMVLEDNAKPTAQRIFVRGNRDNPGAEVPRRFLAVLSPAAERKPFSEGSGRRELAAAIASADNPLTARVFVNRVWMHCFGQGLVRTPSDFGLRTAAPPHRALLDHLAARFVADGWSLKKLLREILLSATWQQSADSPIVDPARQADPDNTLLWHAERRRLDFESLRDGLLAASGALDRTVGGRPVELTKEPFPNRRTVYGFIDRQNLPGLFRVFDMASPDSHTPQRHQTSVPQQALWLMNSPFAIEQALRLAARVRVAEGSVPGAAHIQELHRLVFQRAASDDDVRLANDFLRRPLPADTGKPVEPKFREKNIPLTAWQRYVQVLLLSDEFAFVD